MKTGMEKPTLKWKTRLLRDYTALRQATALGMVPLIQTDCVTADGSSTVSRNIYVKKEPLKMHFHNERKCYSKLLSSLIQAEPLQATAPATSLFACRGTGILTGGIYHKASFNASPKPPRTT